MLLLAGVQSAEQITGTAYLGKHFLQTHPASVSTQILAINVLVHFFESQTCANKVQAASQHGQQPAMPAVLQPGMHALHFQVHPTRQQCSLVSASSAATCFSCNSNLRCDKKNVQPYSF